MRRLLLIPVGPGVRSTEDPTVNPWSPAPRLSHLDESPREEPLKAVHIRGSPPDLGAPTITVIDLQALQGKHVHRAAGGKCHNSLRGESECAELERRPVGTHRHCEQCTRDCKRASRSLCGECMQAHVEAAHGSHGDSTGFTRGDAHRLTWGDAQGLTWGEALNSWGPKISLKQLPHLIEE